MRVLLERIAKRAEGFVELRYHTRTTRRISVRNGDLEESSSVRLTGVGVRALVDGTFGFASTSDLSEEGIKKAVGAAQAAAKTAAKAKRERIARLAEGSCAKGTYPLPTDDPLGDHPLEEKLELVLSLDARVRNGAKEIVSSSILFSEIEDEKVIVTSDGVSAQLFDSKPEIRVIAVAERDGDQTMGFSSVGITGGWSELIGRRSPEELADSASRRAVDQLGAPYPEGGSSVVVLNPELVGILTHEAIGHTVEADLVLGGAVTADKIGHRVASELVTLCDSGRSEYLPHAVGSLPFDDEGIIAGRTVIIDQGILRSYLHNRETAARFGVEATGNGRAFTYSDPPIIRMRNTYIEPGETPFEELIEGIESGYYLSGLGMSGQADSNAEFMFGVREARRITNGRIGGLVRGVTISGNAFQVLQSVDAVGDDFAWDNGSGYCGKGQPAKVDAGGPHIRCTLTIGGKQ